MVTDQIYAMESWDDISIKEFHIFGTEIYPEIHLCASDHYGIEAELQFGK